MRGGGEGGRRKRKGGVEKEKEREGVNAGMNLTYTLYLRGN